MNYALAVWAWGQLAVRASFFGTISVTAGLVPGGRGVSQWCMRMWCKRSADGIRLPRRILGLENLDAAPQAVLVANHLSSLDILVLGGFLKRDYRWLAKASLFKVPFSGWHLQLSGHIPVYRGQARLKNRDIDARIHDVVLEGASLLFFPEGTRSKDGVLRPFKPGAFRAAVREGLPVIPLVIVGTNELLEADALDLKMIPGKECVVTVLPPVSAPSEGSEKERANVLRDRVWDAMHATIEKTREASGEV